MKRKPKIAFIGMTSCKGCFFEFLLLGRKLERLFGRIDIRSFRMLGDFGKGEQGAWGYDIAFMDGAVSTKEQENLLKNVRGRTRFLIAYGTCACFGGIPALRNDSKDYRSVVYPKETKWKSLEKVRPLDYYVKVDYYMRGCPVNEEEALKVVTGMLAGKTPREKDYAVCVECKKRGVTCLFKKGQICYGPVTYAGCGAPCPASGTPCDGCRGPLPDGNVSAEVKLLKEKGITEKEIRNVMSRYAQRQEKKVKK